MANPKLEIIPDSLLPAHYAEYRTGDPDTRHFFARAYSPSGAEFLTLHVAVNYAWLREQVSQALLALQEADPEGGDVEGFDWEDTISKVASSVAHHTLARQAADEGLDVIMPALGSASMKAINGAINLLKKADAKRPGAIKAIREIAESARQGNEADQRATHLLADLWERSKEAGGGVMGYATAAREYLEPDQLYDYVDLDTGEERAEELDGLNDADMMGAKGKAKKGQGKRGAPPPAVVKAQQEKARQKSAVRAKAQQESGKAPKAGPQRPGAPARPGAPSAARPGVPGARPPMAPAPGQRGMLAPQYRPAPEYLETGPSSPQPISIQTPNIVLPAPIDPWAARPLGSPASWPAMPGSPAPQPQYPQAPNLPFMDMQPSSDDGGWDYLTELDDGTLEPDEGEEFAPESDDFEGQLAKEQAELEAFEDATSGFAGPRGPQIGPHYADNPRHVELMHEGDEGQVDSDIGADPAGKVRATKQQIEEAKKKAATDREQTKKKREAEARMKAKTRELQAQAKAKKDAAEKKMLADKLRQDHERQKRELRDRQDRERRAVEQRTQAARRSGERLSEQEEAQAEIDAMQARLDAMVRQQQTQALVEQVADQGQEAVEALQAQLDEARRQAELQAAYEAGRGSGGAPRLVASMHERVVIQDDEDEGDEGDEGFEQSFEQTITREAAERAQLEGVMTVDEPDPSLREAWEREIRERQALGDS